MVYKGENHVPVANPRQCTEASSACLHEVEFSTEPIVVMEEQANNDTCVVSHVRPLIQIRPVPSPKVALAKNADAVGTMHVS